MSRKPPVPAAPAAGIAPALAFVTLGCPKNTVDSEEIGRAHV